MKRTLKNRHARSPGNCEHRFHQDGSKKLTHTKFPAELLEPAEVIMRDCAMVVTASPHPTSESAEGGVQYPFDTRGNGFVTRLRVFSSILL